MIRERERARTRVSPMQSLTLDLPFPVAHLSHGAITRYTHTQTGTIRTISVSEPSFSLLERIYAGRLALLLLYAYGKSGCAI